MLKTGLSAAAVLMLTACGGADSSGGEQIGIDPITQVVVAEGQPDVLYGSVTRGLPKINSSAPPVPLEFVKVSKSCKTPRPSRTAKAAYVYSYGGGDQTPLQYIADANVAKMLAASAANEPVLDSKNMPLPVKQLQRYQNANIVEKTSRVDVLVTETSAPVFLWLTSYNAVLWNIQLAPGASIDGVVVSAYEGGAIANGVSAKRTGFLTFDGSPNSKCYIGGKEKPRTFTQRAVAARGNNVSEQMIKDYKSRWQEEYKQENKFFAQVLPKKLGKNPEWLLYDSSGKPFRAALIGPVPSEPFEPQPLTSIQIPSHVSPFWGSVKGAYQHFHIKM